MNNQTKNAKHITSKYQNIENYNCERMCKNLLSDFFFKLLKGSYENLKLFYTSFMPDKVCGNFNFYEAIPYGARLLSLLLEDDNSTEKQLFIENLKALYDCYESLYPQSTRTIEDGEFDNKTDLFNKAFDNGDLNYSDFNYVINVLISNYRECAFYFELKLNTVEVKFIRKNISQHFAKKEFELKEINNKVYLISGKIKTKISKINSIKELLKAKGCIKAVRISNAIKNIINKIQIKEPCCWCYPVEKTKHKCMHCSKLRDKYKSLTNEYGFLAKDLNQIIKRVQEKCENFTIEELQKNIYNKIKLYINEKCKENQSSAPLKFMSDLTYWYKNI